MAMILRGEGRGARTLGGRGDRGAVAGAGSGWTDSPVEQHVVSFGTLAGLP